MSERIGDWEQTYTGRKWFPLDPRPEDVFLIDIAHPLSQQCRFGGHCSGFYSVAEHSVRVSYLVEQLHAEAVPEGTQTRRMLALWGLLHDAAEAYLLDFVRPMKRQSDLGAIYRKVEAQNMAAICLHFGLPLKEPDTVNYADNVLLATEKRDLMAPEPEPWAPLPEPLPQVIVPWMPERAEQAFLARFTELTNWYPFAHGRFVPDPQHAKAVQRGC